ncbi:MAG: hypothetical protein WCA38_06650 [Candidatus Acidiferrales bacterium]
MIEKLCAGNEHILIEAFENCSFPLEQFRHSVHVRLVFLYLRRYSVLEVLARFPAALARYAAAHGKHGLYNETITWSYIFLIRERLARANRDVTWEEFQNENQDLMTWKNSVLKKYYRDETLASRLAKEVFLFPDKILAGEPGPAVAPE